MPRQANFGSASVEVVNDPTTMRIFLGIDGVDIAVALDSKEKYRQVTEGNDDGTQCSGTIA